MSKKRRSSRFRVSKIYKLSPRIDKCKIQINTYLSVEFDLSIKAFHNGERLLTSHVTLCDVRQFELVLEDISIPRSARIYSEDNSTNSDID